MARPKRFELLTPRFVVWCSIQLSYGREGAGHSLWSRRLQGAGRVQAVGRTEKPPGAGLGGCGLGHLDVFHLRSRRTAAADYDHFADRIGRTFQHRLHAAVATVSHPAGYAVPACFVGDEGTETHALHQASDEEPDRFVFHRWEYSAGARGLYGAWKAPMRRWLVERCASLASSAW